MGAGGRSGDVGSIDEPGLECVLVCVGVSVCVGLVFQRWLRQNVRNSTLRQQLWGTHMSENGRGKGTGMVNAQTVVSMRCAANQRNVVRQSNYALKAINGAGNDIIA